MFGITHYLNNTLEAFFSAVGAFLPILGLMFIHYKVRKSEYKKRKVILLTIRKATESIVDIDENTIKTVYKQLKVKDYNSFIEKVSEPPYSLNTKVINLVNESVSRIFENRQKLLNYTMEEQYSDRYSFKTYISNILDRHYPDEYFVKKKK